MPTTLNEKLLSEVSRELPHDIPERWLKDGEPIEDAHEAIIG